MYDFENEVVRRGTDCVKWDTPFVKDGVTPMWIADMDFAVAPAITKNLQKQASAAAFGYQFLSEGYYNTVIRWFQERHQYTVKREWITYLPNVVVGLHFAVRAVSEPGDEIIIMTPVYGPFYGAVKDNDRTLVESPMKNDHGYYTMDLEDFESRITDKTKAVLLCNPHNPSGRVWSREELKAFADICVKHDLYIISDDIHCELTTKGHSHTFISTLSEEIAQKTIVCTSPSKAFNLASAQVANCFIQNEEVNRKFCELVQKSHGAGANAFAEAALRGAYEESGEWLDELTEYLEGNLDYFVNYVRENIPKLKVYKPEGTYLIWVDFRESGIEPEKVQEYLLNECNVAVNDGEFFGKEGKGFARFNVACPRHTITPVLETLKEKLNA